MIRLLIAAAYLFAACTAQAGFFVNSYSLAPVGTPASVAFQACTSDTSDLTTYSFAGAAIGPEGNKTVAVVVTGGDPATAFGVSSMTIGGVSATELVDFEGVGRLTNTAIYALGSVTGTTATISVTWSEAITEMQICVFALYDLNSATPTNTVSGFTTGGAALSLDSNVDALGVVVGGCSTAAASQTHTWTGLTERSDATVGGYSDTSADYTEDASPSSPLTIVCDVTGINATTGAVAAFR